MPKPVPSADAQTGASASLSPAQSRLAQLPPLAFGLYAGLMAFGVYFAMYAFRKPFTVADFGTQSLWGVDFKTVLIIAQVLGYALSKLAGVKIIAELPAHRRVLGIIAQIALAEVALLAFALIPAPWNAACLLLNGLALGMIWGMVFAFVEGRRQSEFIAAILCASFILSSGVVKAVGAWLLLRGTGSLWMPATTGAIFAPLLLICLYGLSILPPPTAQDEAERVARKPMDGPARRQLWQRYALGLSGLVLLYVMLTALRDFRDNFAADIWREIGLGGQADLFAWTELPVSLVVLAALASLMVFADNRKALAANFVLIGVGLALAGGCSLAFALHLLGAVPWMILLGAGLYLAYTPFNGILFDRLLASGGTPGNAGFLIYVADASGYGGSVALLLIRNLPGLHRDPAPFLVTVSLLTAALGLALLAGAWVYFDRRAAATAATVPA